MTWLRPRLPELAILGWVVVSLALSLLPTGVGGPARAINAVVFMGFGPGCAVMVRLAGRWSGLVCSVIALAVTLTVLILSSQLLLVLGAWSVPAVAGLVALVTVMLALVPLRDAVGEGNHHG